MTIAVDWDVKHQYRNGTDSHHVKYHLMDEDFSCVKMHLIILSLVCLVHVIKQFYSSVCPSDID